MCFFSKRKSWEKMDIAPPTSFIKERAKILFIDDQEVPLVSILQDEGWHVEKWSDIKNLKDLEGGAFDLIFLDIGGVGKSYSPDEGFGILKRLKSVNPSLLIIAYSGQSFDADKFEFWKIADDQLSKGSGAIKAIEKIESLLVKKWTPKQLNADLNKLFDQIGVSEKLKRQINKQLIKSIPKDYDEGRIKKLLADIDAGDGYMGPILSLCSKLASVVSAILQAAN